MNSRFSIWMLICILGVAVIVGCKSKDETTTGETEIKLPKKTVEAKVSFVDVNCWIENNMFNVIGICNNESDYWHKIWIDMTPVDSNGNRLIIGGRPSVLMVVNSDAVPPRGRSSFFMSWPVSKFSGKPDSCLLAGAGAEKKEVRPILIGMEASSVRMINYVKQGDTMAPIERVRQISFSMHNPIGPTANHPKFEFLIYGTDNKLWMSQILDLTDPKLQTQVGLNSISYGPVAPGEKRLIGFATFYEKLPVMLQNGRFGKVDFIPFESMPPNPAEGQ